MSISDYVIKLQQLDQIGKSHKMEVLGGVLAYRLLNNAKLPEEKKQLVRATVNEIEYKIMKEQHKKVFTSLSFEKRSREEALKLEQSDSFYAEDFAILPSAFNKNSYQKRNSKLLQNPSNSDGKVSRCRTCDSKFYWAADVSTNIISDSMIQEKLYFLKKQMIPY